MTRLSGPTLEMHLQTILYRMPRKQVGRIDRLLRLGYAIDERMIKALETRRHGNILCFVSHKSSRNPGDSPSHRNVYTRANCPTC